MTSEEFKKRLLIESADIYSEAKDKNFRFVSCSENLANLLGEASPQAVIGKTDYELVWRNDADFFRQTDIGIMRGEIHYTNVTEEIDVIKSGKKVRQTILITKTANYNKKNEVTGIIGAHICLVVDLSNAPLFDEQGNLQLPSALGDGYLTKKEVLVLQRILLGEPAKKIAKHLGLSWRTVEHYTNNIKRKLQCTYKHQINKVVLDMGLVPFLGQFE